MEYSYENMTHSLLAYTGASCKHLHKQVKLLEKSVSDPATTMPSVNLTDKTSMLLTRALSLGLQPQAHVTLTIGKKREVARVSTG